MEQERRYTRSFYRQTESRIVIQKSSLPFMPPPRTLIDVAEHKVKRGWEFDPDFIEGFDEWALGSLIPKNAAAQLGLWIVMHMNTEVRGRCETAMLHGLSHLAMDLQVLSRDEDTILRDFRRLADPIARERLLDAARGEVLQEEALDRDLTAPEARASETPSAGQLGDRLARDLRRKKRKSE